MRPKSHTGELEPEAVLTHSLNPFSLDYSVHFFSPMLFFPHFIIQHFHLYSELKKEQMKTKINSNLNSTGSFSSIFSFLVLLFIYKVYIGKKLYLSRTSFFHSTRISLFNMIPLNNLF